MKILLSPKEGWGKNCVSDLKNRKSWCKKKPVSSLGGVDEADLSMIDTAGIEYMD